ncbi:hypothetical protein [Ideonella sp.]|uniref:hypothetical protein n=1 Tax=Ideonella sp. TaxID=1929293 RepID=UPI0035B2A2B0
MTRTASFLPRRLGPVALGLWALACATATLAPAAAHAAARPAAWRTLHGGALPRMAQASPTPAAAVLGVASGHPVIGLWDIEVEDSGCHETYDVRPDGTVSVTSGRQMLDARFMVAPEPDEDGFYAWADQIVRDNGEPDCLGERAEVGQLAFSFLYFDHGQRQFLMCESESLDACIGPFRRLDDDA